MQKKEHYRGSLPHFQQPGQWYFITCILFDAMPKHALKDYSEKIKNAHGEIAKMLEEAKTDATKKYDEIIKPIIIGYPNE